MKITKDFATQLCRISAYILQPTLIWWRHQAAVKYITLWAFLLVWVAIPVSAQRFDFSRLPAKGVVVTPTAGLILAADEFQKSPLWQRGNITSFRRTATQIDDRRTLPDLIYHISDAQGNLQRTLYLAPRCAVLNSWFCGCGLATGGNVIVSKDDFQRLGGELNTLSQPLAAHYGVQVYVLVATFPGSYGVNPRIDTPSALEQHDAAIKRYYQLEDIAAVNAEYAWRLEMAYRTLPGGSSALAIDEYMNYSVEGGEVKIVGAVLSDLLTVIPGSVTIKGAQYGLRGLKGQLVAGVVFTSLYQLENAETSAEKWDIALQLAGALVEGVQVLRQAPHVKPPDLTKLERKLVELGGDVKLADQPAFDDAGKRIIAFFSKGGGNPHPFFPPPFAGPPRPPRELIRERLQRLYPEMLEWPEIKAILHEGDGMPKMEWVFYKNSNYDPTTNIVGVEYFDFDAKNGHYFFRALVEAYHEMWHWRTWVNPRWRAKMGYEVVAGMTEEDFVWVNIPKYLNDEGARRLAAAKLLKKLIKRNYPGLDVTDFDVESAILRVLDDIWVLSPQSRWQKIIWLSTQSGGYEEMYYKPFRSLLRGVYSQNSRDLLRIKGKTLLPEPPGGWPTRPPRIRMP